MQLLLVEVFDHQGRSRIQFFNLSEIGRIVEHAIADKRFVYLDGGMFGRHRDVFGVTADNPWSEYATYLTEIEKLNPAPTLMIEHLDEQQLHQGLQFIFAQAAAIGITFEGASHRTPAS